MRFGAVLTGLFLILALPVLAQGRGMGGMPGYGPGTAPRPVPQGPQSIPQGKSGYPGAGDGQVGLDSLNLGEDQVTRINGILHDLTVRECGLELQMMDAQGALWRRQAAEAQDPQALRQAYDRLARLRQQAYADRMATRDRIVSVLTPEQRSRWQGGRGADKPPVFRPVLAGTEGFGGASGMAPDGASEMLPIGVPPLFWNVSLTLGAEHVEIE